MKAKTRDKNTKTKNNKNPHPALNNKRFKVNERF
jgi:hypothetical protein